jgi:uncharacterized protein (DUF885 family)
MPLLSGATPTLTISPKKVFNRGQNMVAESTAQVVAIGRRLYHTSDFTEIVAKVKADPANRFRSGQELFEYSRQLMDAAREKSKSLFLELPEQPLRIESLPTYLDSSGVPSHYEANATDARPAIFWIALNDWPTRHAAPPESAWCMNPGPVTMSRQHWAEPRSLAGSSPPRL